MPEQSLEYDYSDVYPATYDTWLYECLFCGALVRVKERHTAWHEGVTFNA